MLITGVNSTLPKLSPWTCIYEVIPDFKSMPSVPHGQNTNHRITNKSHLSWHTSFAGIGSRTKMKLNEWNARMNKNNNNNNYTALFFTLSLDLFFLSFFRKKKKSSVRYHTPFTHVHFRMNICWFVCSVHDPNTKRFLFILTRTHRMHFLCLDLVLER